MGLESRLQLYMYMHVAKASNFLSITSHTYGYYLWCSGGSRDGLWSGPSHSPRVVLSQKGWSIHNTLPQFLGYPLVVGPRGQKQWKFMQVKAHIMFLQKTMYIMWCSKDNMQHLLMQSLTSIDSHVLYIRYTVTMITNTEHIMMVILAMLNIHGSILGLQAHPTPLYVYISQAMSSYCPYKCDCPFQQSNNNL